MSDTPAKPSLTPDRDRAMVAVSWVEPTEQREAIVDAMLEFAANQYECQAIPGRARAAQLRAQKSDALGKDKP